MSRSKFRLTIRYLLPVMLLIFAMVMISCRRQEEQEEATVPPPTATDTPVDTLVPDPTAEPTAVDERGAEVDIPEVEITYDWPPQLIYSSPVPGEKVMLDGAITLRFDQPMDEASVEEVFHVSPVGSAESIQGSLQWPRADTLVFTPQDQLERQQIYDVQVADSARGRNGKTLRQEIDLQLETIGFLEVSQTIPGDGAEEIQTETAITVAFNKPVVPIVTTGQQADLPQPLSFEPAVSGQGQWISTSIYRFIPDEPLDGAANYQAIVSAGLEDVTGSVLAEDYSWRFSTMSPSVVSIVPDPHALNVIPTGPYSVTFNMPMDRAATESAISFSPNVPHTTDWDEENQTITLIPEEQLLRDTDYDLIIQQSARSANGQANLDRDYQISFRTVPLPAVLSTDPVDGGEAFQYQNGFSVEFASPMDPETLEDQIQITPAPEETDVYIDNDNFRMFVSFELEKNNTYEVTIPASAADPWGNTLGEDYTFRFTTPPLEPLVSLNLPNQPPISQMGTYLPTNVDVVYRNISGFEAQLYELDLPVSYLSQYYFSDGRVPTGPLLNSWPFPSDLAQDEVGIQTIELADGGTLPTGIYFLEVGAPEVDPETRWWQNQQNIIIVSDSNLVVKQTFEGIYCWATDLASGQPAAGLALTFYDRDGLEIGTATTAENGLASINYEPRESYMDGALVVANGPGEDGFGVASTNWNRNIEPWKFGFPSTTEEEQERFMYLYTDRPIYRPGDTVYFKGIVRDTDYGRYPLPVVEDVTLTLMFLNDYSEIDFEYETTVDENGEFDGEYQIPEDAALGNYQLFFSSPNGYADRIFSVAEYRKPEFQVTLTPSTEETLRGQPVEFLLEAEYFFGGTASDLEVNWSVQEDGYRLPWEGPYYSFGDDANFYYDPGSPFDFGGGTFGNYLDSASGTGVTDANGQLTIRLPADLLDEVDPGSRTVTVQADVLDISNFPITARNSVVFHAADTYVGVRPVEYISTAGTESSVDLITVDWDGQLVPDSEVEVIFYEREWEPVRDSQFGQPFTLWEAIDTEVSRQAVVTDDQGEGSASFVPENGGQYLAVATVTDDSGRNQTSSTSLWVTDSAYIGWRSDPRERRMDMTVDQDEYKPGDVAQILVQSPFEGPIKAWLTIERGDVIDERVITLESNSDVLEIPITSHFAPNVFVSVAAVKGVDASNEYADMRLGIVELVVSPEQLALNLNMAPQEDLLQPGETAAYDLSVTDSQGRGVQSSLSLALVDLAVLSLKADNAPPILEAFYDRQFLRSLTGSGLIQSGEGLEIEVPEQIPGRGGGGGGDAEAVAAFKLEGEVDDFRQDFPDTAYWEAKVVTDADGRATVEIPLPDNLTTWRLSSKAVSDYAASGDTLVGQSEVDVITTLPLFIRPVTPRFFVVGDTLQLGAVVHNNTGQSQEIAVSLEADGLTLLDEAERMISLNDGERELVRWLATVDDVPFVDMTFWAEADGFSDATKPTFGIPPGQLVPVVRYAGEDFVGTSGVLEEPGRQVEAILLPESVDERQGEVKVQLEASLAAALIEALESSDLQLRPDLHCAHPFADELLANVATATALQTLALDKPGLKTELDELVNRDLARLAELQLEDGGWGYCYSQEMNPFLTAYILFALTKAEQAGYEMPINMASRAEVEVAGFLEDARLLNSADEVNAQAFYLYVLAERGFTEAAELDDLFSEQRSLMDPYAKALTVLAYELTGGSSSNQETLLADLNDSAILSATGAHWEDAVPDWDNLSSDIRGTAMVLDALALVEPDSILAPNAVRWLMSARTAGHWTTSHETAWTVLSLSDWMAVSGELEADFDFVFLVNGREESEGQFAADNLTESEKINIPVGEMILDDTNFLDFQHGQGPGRLYYTTHLDSFIRAEGVQAVDRGVVVQRAYFDADCDPDLETCQPISEIEAGRPVRVELSIIVPNDLVYAIIEDPIPSGAEAIDPLLETTAADRGPTFQPIDEDYLPGYWGWWYFNRVEFRDDKVVFSSEFLPAGTYLYTYELQPLIPGEYQVIPATARQEFFPEVFGRSDGFLFEITE